MVQKLSFLCCALSFCKKTSLKASSILFWSMRSNWNQPIFFVLIWLTPLKPPLIIGIFVRSQENTNSSRRTLRKLFEPWKTRRSWSHNLKLTCSTFEVSHHQLFVVKAWEHPLPPSLPLTPLLILSWWAKRFRR